MQHLYAIRIRDRINVQGWSIGEYAGKAGTSYDRMLKILRGTALLRLEDIAVADLLVGEVSEFAVEGARQLSAATPAASVGSADTSKLAAYRRAQEVLRRPPGRRL